MSQLQTYNGMDTIATFELWTVLEKLLAENKPAKDIYEFSLRLQQPALYAMMRGVLVDREEIGKLREKFEAECKQLEATMDFITKSLKMGVINFASPVQVKWLFSCLGAEIESTDIEAMEKVTKAHPDLSPVVNIIRSWRDRAKMISVLKDNIFDQDDRCRTTYKIGGTVTGRWSSSKNCLWTGMNMQNIKREEDEDKVGHASIRSMFIADPGKKFCNMDLERADSWGVGLEVFKCTGDDSYLNACASQDLHTYVSRLVWPDLGWTGDFDHDVAIAEQFFYRQYDYRFMSKKGGHGSNYLGKPWTLAHQMKIAVWVAERFQKAYFRAFPGIPQWQKIKARELQTTGQLINLFGRPRNFHDRLDSDATIREAIAYLGQSVTADSINKVIEKLWLLMALRPDLGIEFLAQVHDSCLIQYPEEKEQEIMAILPSFLSIPITVQSPSGHVRTEAIPMEYSVGWNWAKVNKKNPAANPDGLKKLKSGRADERQRQRNPETKEANFMDRRVSSILGNNAEPIPVS